MAEGEVGFSLTNPLKEFVETLYNGRAVAIEGKTSGVGFWDRAGIGVTLLCLIHCLALPLLVSAFPFLPFHHNHEVHLALALLAVPVGIAALIPGYRRHKNRLIPLSGLIGLNFLVGAETYGEVMGLGSESLISATGALILIAAHASNWYLCTRECRGRCHH